MTTAAAVSSQLVSIPKNIKSLFQSYWQPLLHWHLHAQHLVHIHSQSGGSAQVGSELTKAEVLLPNGAIRDLGHYEVALDLGFEVGASIKLAVVAIGATDDVSADGSLIDEIDAEAAAADAEDEAPAE